jgi:phage-related minor tail protein
MSLTVGELTGYLSFDTSELDRGMGRVGRGMEQLRHDLDTGADRAGQQLAAGLGRGADRAGQQLAAGVEDGADHAHQAVVETAERIVADAEQAGDRAGDALGDGIEAGGEDGGRRGGAAIMHGLKGARGGIVAVVAAIGAAAGAALVSGLQDALKQDVIKDRLAAQLGATPKQAEAYGRAAGKLYANAVTDTFEDAADTIRAVMQGGLLPPDATEAQVEGISMKVSDLASLFGQDLGGVVNAVSQMIRTGLAKNATQALDLLTKGLESPVNKADDLVDTFNEYGVQFKKAGLDGVSALGLMNQAIQAGAKDSDLAADAIKEFSIRAVDGSATTKDGFKQLGLSADDMARKFAKGGKTANGVLDLTLNRLRNVEDPVKRAAIATELFGTQSEDLGAALYAMDPSSAAAGIDDVGGAAKRMGDTLRDNASTRVEQFKRRAMQGLVTFLGDHVVPAIDAFADRYSGTFRHVADDAGQFWRKVRPHLSKVVDAVDEVSDAFDGKGGGDGFEQRVGGTLREVGDVVDTGMQAVEQIWDAHGEEIMRAFHAVWDEIGPTIDGTLRTIKGIIEVVTGLINGDWSQFWQGIKDITSGQLEVIVSKIRGVLTLAATIFEAGLGIIWDLISAAWDKVYGYTTEKLGAAYNWVKGLPGRMTNAFADWSIVRMVTGFWSDTYDVTTFYGGRMVTYVKGLPGRAVNALGDLSLTLYNAGWSLISGFIHGITDRIGDVKSTLGGLTDKLTSWKGPADRDAVILRPAGRLVLGGFIDGIADQAPALRSQLGSLTDELSGMVPGVDGDPMAGLVSVPRVPGAPGAGYGAAGGTAAAGGGIAGRWVLDVTGGEDAFVRWVRGWVRAEGGTGDDSAQRALAGV